jgi:AbrB family looped-hinge helix DNA binding protein
MAIMRRSTRTAATVDEFGRIVIPKRVRTDFGLEPGSVLEVDESEAGILLRPAPRSAPLRIDGGVLVFTGRATSDIEGALRRQREERVAGLTRSRRR